VSLAVLQNWSMHVKYASRHVLYPVPNVFECTVFIVNVARAGRVAVRTLPWFVLKTAPRATVFDAALRVVVDAFAVRAVVAGRALVRAVVAVRATVLRDVVRAVVFCWVLFALREMVDLVVCRDGELASRTAASTVPTPINSAVMRYITFLILNNMFICYQKMAFIANKKCPKWGDF